MALSAQVKNRSNDSHSLGDELIKEWKGILYKFQSKEFGRLCGGADWSRDRNQRASLLASHRPSKSWPMRLGGSLALPISASPLLPIYAPKLSTDSGNLYRGHFLMSQDSH